MALSNAEKGKLAALVITQVADMFEDWGHGNDEARDFLTRLYQEHGIGRDEALLEVRDVVSKWMAKLPGSYWDMRLGKLD